MTDLLSLHYPVDTFALIALTFLFAGLIKGMLGFGLPAVLIATLTLIMSPLEVLPLILIPMLLLNVFQFIRGPEPLVAARKYKVFAIFFFITVMLVALNLRHYPEEFILIAIGIAMILFALPSLLGWRFAIGPNSLWQVLGGLLAGVMGGISAIWAPPIVLYLLGRNVSKDEFVGAVGYLFMIGSIGIGIALGSINLLTAELLLPSLIGLGIALLGFRIGEMLRNKINTENFRKLILIAFLLMGVRLILIGAF